jgi:hypothetical protein
VKKKKWTVEEVEDNEVQDKPLVDYRYINYLTLLNTNWLTPVLINNFHIILHQTFVTWSVHPVSMVSISFWHNTFWSWASIIYALLNYHTSNRITSYKQGKIVTFVFNISSYPLELWLWVEWPHKLNFIALIFFKLDFNLYTMSWST